MRHIVFGRVSTFRICIACDQATTNRILFWNYHLQLDRFEEEFICPYTFPRNYNFYKRPGSSNQLMTQ
jgi:hypothetical protein